MEVLTAVVYDASLIHPTATAYRHRLLPPTARVEES